MKKTILLVGLICLLMLSGCGGNVERCVDVCIKQDMVLVEYNTTANKCICEKTQPTEEVNEKLIQPCILKVIDDRNYDTLCINTTGIEYCTDSYCSYIKDNITEELE